LFTPIRDLFAKRLNARARPQTGAVQFNVKGGRCEGCQGDGLNAS
jgi:excinuclease ABC subunit A